MSSEQEEWTDEKEDAAEAHGRDSRLPLLAAIAGLALLSMCVLALVLLLRDPVRSLRPFRTEPDPVELIVDGQPLLVTFAELSENAADFKNKRIRVTGIYLPLLPPECTPFNGPLIHWSLVSEGLQLNARGFERPLAIISPGTTLTVEGIWRQYEGSVGCGKEPQQGNVWYLQVERIIQPNPLVASTADPQAFLLKGVVTPMFPTPGPSRTPAGPGIAPTVLPLLTPTSLPSLTATGTVVTPLPGLTATATATSTQTGTPGFVGTNTPAGTPGPGTATATATPTGTITPGTPIPTPTNGPQPTVPGLTPYPGGTVSPPAGTATTRPGY